MHFDRDLIDYLNLLFSTVKDNPSFQISQRSDS